MTPAPVARKRRENPRVTRSRQRVQQFFEPGPDRRAGWRRQPRSAEYGVPGAHGVDVFRGQTHYMGDASWRHNLPRLPLGRDVGVELPGARREAVAIVVVEDRATTGDQPGAGLDQVSGRATAIFRRGANITAPPGST